MCLCASPIHRLQKVLSDSKEEVEILVKNYKSPAKLASFVVEMKRLILYFKQGTHTKRSKEKARVELYHFLLLLLTCYKMVAHN